MPPQPITPMVMRLEGAGRSARPKTVAGTNAGSASVAPPAAARKRRRVNEEFAGEFFIRVESEIFRLGSQWQAPRDPELKGLPRQDNPRRVLRQSSCRPPAGVLASAVHSVADVE